MSRLAGTRSLLSLLRASFSPRYRSPRHCATVLAFVCAIFAIRSVVKLGRALDLALFPGLRDVPIREPLYVLGNPRSGTTFLHYLLSLDPRFTTLHLYQTILPSLVLERAVRGIARMDARIGTPLGRLLGTLDRASFGGWEGIHKTGLAAPEEDEMYFMYFVRAAGACMLFPHLRALPETYLLDRSDPEHYERLRDFVRSSLQRHLYEAGPDRTLLVKTAMGAGRLDLYEEVAPDMRIVMCIRHPYEQIPSMISMFTRPWRFHCPDLVGATKESRDLARMSCDFYRVLLAKRRALPDERVYEVHYEDLVRDPREAVEAIYRHFGLAMSGDYASRLAYAAGQGASHCSGHDYDIEEFGIDRSWIHAELKDLFEEYGWCP